MQTCVLTFYTYITENYMEKRKIILYEYIIINQKNINKIFKIYKFANFTVINKITISSVNIY